MSIQAYSFCDVELRSKTGRSSDQQSYERCSVELHHNDYDGYSLRAVRRWDKKEIFDLPLNNVSSYIMGGSPQIPDQFLGDDGTYLLLLTGEGSKTYREALNACLTDLLLTKNTPVASDTEQSSGILASIQNLTEAINQGRTDAAARAAESLISKNIQLKATLNQSYRGEQLFKIRIKIDRLNAHAQNNDGVTEMDVYASTRIRELRALFFRSHRFPVMKQYFFVNGHLAFEEASMRELNVHANALFVLLVLD